MFETGLLYTTSGLESTNSFPNPEKIKLLFDEDSLLWYNVRIRTH